MLKNSGQRTFVTKYLIEKLGIRGRKTEIIIEPLNREQNMKSELIAELKVPRTGIGKSSRWLNLLETYNKEKLPADVEEVPT